MLYRNIPGTDLNVSALGFGNFVFGTNWWGEFSDDEGIALQNFAFDQGVNFFDSGAAYGNGRAESLLAKTIEYAGRENVVVSTKFGYDFYSDVGDSGHRERKQDFSASFMRHDLEMSLKRLKVDCIDLYQAHNLKLPQFQDEMFDTLKKFQEEGKVRYWGIALGPAIGWREEGYKSFIECKADVVQTVFNMYEQDPGREFCEISEQLGRGGVISRVPTNSGILDEEFKSSEHTFPPNDHRKFRDKNWLIYGLKKNDVMQPIAKQYNCNLRQLAFKWLLSFPTLVSVEPNLLTEKDVRDYCEACEGPELSAETLKQIETLYATDFHMGADAHPCDWKSSVTPDGTIRSAYQKPVVAG